MNETNVVIPQRLPPHLDTKEKRRDFIFALEESLSRQPHAMVGDNPNTPVEHIFCEGMYVRDICIPAGILLTGKIHKHEHPNFLLSGSVAMITEDGGLVYMSAPQSIVSEAGCKRAIYTFTDTRWATVHLNPNGHTKPCEELEGEIIAKDYKELEFDGGQE